MPIDLLLGFLLFKFLRKQPPNSSDASLFLWSTTGRHSAKYSEGQHGNFSLVDVKCGPFHILMFHTLKYCYSCRVSVNAFVVLRGAGVSTTCWKSYSFERNADRPRNPSTAQINQSFPHSSSRPINICQGLNRLALSIQYVT